MSSRWFRFYADAMRNPKIARLSDKQFRLWVQLLSVAAENDGKIPCIEDLKHILNRRLDHLLTGIKELLSAGLIDLLDDGYEPHSWNKFQYKSDTSNERVAKHRAKRNVTVTPPETETEAEAERVIEPNGSMGAIPLFEETEVASEAPSLRPEHVQEEWNELAKKLGKPIARDITPERRQTIKARIAQYSLDDFVTVFGMIERSPFLRGDTGWKGCNFDWVIQKKNFQKIIEGNYDQ